jgi:hypothetical protein
VKIFLAMCLENELPIDPGAKKSTVNRYYTIDTSNKNPCTSQPKDSRKITAHRPDRMELIYYGIEFAAPGIMEMCSDITSNR